ncbi:translation initiation factor-like protein eif-2b epsilon subunit [Aureobasidium pullulans]|nr:translation initiation factor-like protein eif-2b epsilon subunit [Aureobasidium pullulans]
MAPKKKAAQADKGRIEDEVEEPLQAVILADSFETRFSPFTLERPRCLLPLANTPLIEYTFEFLANAGVDEVFVYCGAHTDQVEEYVQQSKWTSKVSPFNNVEIVRSSSNSIGDAMRDLDARAVLTGDFLIVYGDVVSNLPIEAAIAAHRQRRTKDKNAIMTMVLREAGTVHRTKMQRVSPVFVLDPTKNRCLHYEQMRPNQPSHLVTLDPDILKEHDELEIREDLIDCGIDICTPDVLALWSDNFDYEAPRKGFLHSVLKDYELNGKTIHTHIVDEHYAARVKNLRAYDAVTKDILSRWAYPICPDSNLVRDQTYRLTKGNVYREEGVVLARSCHIGSRTVIGRATAIGDGSEISNSVIGRRCIIGRNVKIDGAYIWDDASIGDGTVVKDAIIANEASVGKKCNIMPGALLSYGVYISDGMTINSRITKMKRESGYEQDEIVRGQTDKEVVGQKGEGFEYETSEDEDEDDQEHHSLHSSGIYNMQNQSAESISTLNSETYSEEYEGRAEKSSRSESFLSIGSVDSEDSRAGREAVDFHHDAAASIYDSLQKGDEAANIQLELTALRMSANASPHMVRRAVVAAFMKRMASLMEEGLTPAQAAKKTIPTQQMLIERTMFDRGESYPEKVDQVDFLLLVQADVCHRADGEKIMLHVCNELYMGDALEFEGVMQWWKDEKSEGSDELKQIKLAMGQFVDAIKAAEESESEEESSEEETAQATVSSPHIATTPPLTRKRKLLSPDTAAKQKPKINHPAQSPAASVTADSHPAKQHVTDAAEDKPAASPDQLPATPQTLKGSVKAMDSDDDYNSVASLNSDMEFGEDDENSSVADFAADSDIDLDDDGDIGFDSQDKDLKPRKKAYEVDFSVYSPQDIQTQQDRQIEEVSNILGQPHEATAILMRYMRWNKERLIEQYMDKQEEVLEKAGLGQDVAGLPSLEVIDGFVCDICCDDTPGLQTFAMKCGHRFCVDCYRQYLAQKIKDEGEAARIRCPGEQCNNIVDSKSLELLVTQDLKDRYQELLTRTYVDDKDNLRWCPAPNCVYAVECPVKQKELNKIVPTVHCDCGHNFCFGCQLNDHQPTPCVLVKLWMKKCEDDSETANWISANTKECPKCNSTIEKNGGCNHMTCRKCKYEFCWMCMGLWSEHGTSWYNCNRYEEKSGHTARDAQAKSRASLERYLHYYNRYANHELSAKLDKDIYLKTEKKMMQLQSTSGMSWIEVQFLDYASQALQQCRQTLKWTYAFAYYLERNNLTEIFEDNQKDLEMAVEALSGMFEKPTDQLSGLKVEMMDKTTYCNKRRIILLDDTADNLKKGNWKFNVDELSEE